ncbi:hypothetical protein [Paenibacillus lautus]|uniref:hypothetical protein n=1 Tax=Paenibacillus lautus TaxID=1401 RepID=UPI0013E2FB6C|nr:hypothetical protein [Paenibacillus lautus]
MKHKNQATTAALPSHGFDDGVVIAVPTDYQESFSAFTLKPPPLTKIDFSVE